MPDPEGGVTDVGGVFILGPLCEPGACSKKEPVIRSKVLPLQVISQRDGRPIHRHHQRPLVSSPDA